MSAPKMLHKQKKLRLAGKLMEFLEKEVPADRYSIEEQLEVLMLAYHARTSTDYFKRSFS